jgi:hypothetical protein
MEGFWDSKNITLILFNLFDTRYYNMIDEI